MSESLVHGMSNQEPEGIDILSLPIQFQHDLHFDKAYYDGDLRCVNTTFICTKCDKEFGREFKYGLATAMARDALLKEGFTARPRFNGNNIEKQLIRNTGVCPVHTIGYGQELALKDKE